MFPCKLCADYGKKRQFKSKRDLVTHIESREHNGDIAQFIYRHRREIHDADSKPRK